MSMYVGNVIYGGVITLVGTTVMQLPLEARNAEAVSCAHIDVEGGPIRFFVHGEEPTPIVGHPVLEDASVAVVGGNNVKELRMVAQDADLGAVVTWSVGTGALL